MAYIGVDVGGTKLLIATIERGELHAIEVPVPTTFHEFLTTARQLIFQLIKGDFLDGIGLGIPGIVRDDGTCWAPNSSCLHGQDVDEIRQYFGVRLVVQNDAQLALWAESRLGKARGYENVVLVAVGTGIGGSLLINGEIVSGNNHAAGAFGWMRILYDRQWMTWESLASGRALDQKAYDNGIKGGGPALMDLARQDSSISKDLIDEWIDVLGNGIATLGSVFDPQLILLSGGISRNADLILPKLREVVRSQGSEIVRTMVVDVAELGHYAVVWGALLKVCKKEREGGGL